MENSTEIINPIKLDEKNSGVIESLIRASHKNPMELEIILPWSNGIDFDKPPKDEKGSWIYETPYWGVLNSDQQRELLWTEIARDISMFIWLEQTIPPLYIGYVNRYPFELSNEVYEYLMIFSKEEIIHTLMFRKFMKIAGLNLFKPPSGEYATFIRQLPTMHPVVGILWTLMIEWSAENNAMLLTQGDDIEPLTKKMFREHHIEELRHIAFGKRVIENYFNAESNDQLDPIRKIISALFRNLKSQLTFNIEIAQYVSFDFPVAENENDKIDSIRNSENNKQLNLKRFADVSEWLEELGISI